MNEDLEELKEVIDKYQAEGLLGTEENDASVALASANYERFVCFLAGRITCNGDDKSIEGSRSLFSAARRIKRTLKGGVGHRYSISHLSPITG